MFCGYMGKNSRLEVYYLNITQDMLMREIADKEDMNIAAVRKLFKSAEDIIFEYLSSTAPSEDINIRLFNGISIKSKYVKKKNYSKGMFQNISCPEHINVKACLSRYYNKQLNQRLFLNKI